LQENTVRHRKYYKLKLYQNAFLILFCGKIGKYEGAFTGKKPTPQPRFVGTRTLAKALQTAVGYKTNSAKNTILFYCGLMQILIFYRFFAAGLRQQFSVA
jgi:hypothetical protein